MTEPRQLADGPLDCAAVELWLAEAAEMTLPAAIAEGVRRHAMDCAACAEKLTEASRGREWLLILKQEPLEPPADIVAKILARTSLAGDKSGLGSASEGDAGRVMAGAGFIGAGVPAGAESDGGSVPYWQRSSVVVLRRTLLDPRLALVAAMAFFSISLTLNLLGVRFSGLRASDLEPANLHRTFTRQAAETHAGVVRYYENLRIVYEVEARVQQLRRAAQTGPPSQAPRPRKQSFDPAGNTAGHSSSRFARQGRRALPDPRPIPFGPAIDTAFHRSARQFSPFRVKSLLRNEQIVEPVFLQPRSCCLWSSAAEHTLAASPVFSFEVRPAMRLCFLRCSMRAFPARERRLA